MKLTIHGALKLKNMNREIPFASHKEDLMVLGKVAKKYRKYTNIIIIGSGGSVNNFRALLSAVPSKKKVSIIDTVDPSKLETIKKENPKNKTVVVAISKSGDTVTTIESLLYFSGYPTVAITGGGALEEIAKEMEFELVEHADIGGRFSANTASLLLPMMLAGMDVKKFLSGLSKSYKNSLQSKRLASFLNEAEKKGNTDLFVPIYSSKLSGTFTLITQLLHETVSKNKKGMTIFGGEAPETQHHTNQRVFGGRKNVAILLLLSEEKGKSVVVPKSVEHIVLRDGLLKRLNGKYYDALQHEYEGTLTHAMRERMPCATISLSKINEESMGELLGLLQVAAIYSARLDNVSPFNQPHVESSKRISFDKRTN